MDLLAGHPRPDRPIKLKLSGYGAETDDVGRLGRLAANIQPYDPVVARRAAAGVLAAFAAIDFVGTVTAGLSPQLTIAVGYVFPVFLLIWAGVVLGVSRPWVERCIIVNPLLAIALISVVVVATRDTTSSGQLAYCAPVLFGASQLRATGAVIVLVTTMGCEPDHEPPAIPAPKKLSLGPWRYVQESISRKGT